MSDTTTDRERGGLNPGAEAAAGTIAFAKYGDPSLPASPKPSAARSSTGVGVEWVYPSELQRRISVAVAQRGASIGNALREVQHRGVSAAMTRLRSGAAAEHAGPGL